jgi:hypothetical protein
MKVLSMPAQHGVVLGEPALQRHGQVRDLRPGPADGELGHDRAAALPADELLDHPVGPAPVMPVATEPSLMPAVSSVLARRWAWELRAWTVFTLYLVSSGGGVQEPCSSPHSSSSAIRALSFAVGLAALDRLDVLRVDHEDPGEVLLGQRVIDRLGAVFFPETPVITACIRVNRVTRSFRDLALASSRWPASLRWRSP